MNQSKNGFYPFLSAVLLLNGLTFCSSNEVSDNKNNGSDVQKQARQLQEELLIGEEMSARILGHFGVYKAKNDNLKKYINVMTQVMARKAGRPEIVYRVEIINEDFPNAFAVPGGYIFLTKGLLKELNSEEELAGVLAHEIAHVNERHVYKKVVSDDAGIGATLARTVGGGRSTLGSVASKAAMKGLEMLLETGYGPELELEADQFGVSLMVESGYSPVAYYNFLRRLSKIETASNPSKTHPPFKQRLDGLWTFMKDQGLDKYKSKAKASVLASRFERNKKLL
jgi:predicted Zn-dependent protease